MNHQGVARHCQHVHEVLDGAYNNCLHAYASKDLFIDIVSLVACSVLVVEQMFRIPSFVHSLKLWMAATVLDHVVLQL